MMWGSLPVKAVLHQDSKLLHWPKLSRPKNFVLPFHAMWNKVVIEQYLIQRRSNLVLSLAVRLCQLRFLPELSQFSVGNVRTFIVNQK